MTEAALSLILKNFHKFSLSYLESNFFSADIVNVITQIKDAKVSK